ncbi:MAG: MFS transporter [Steroidobacteraceae bacterium]
MSDDAARAGALARLLNRVARVEARESSAVVIALLLFFFVLGGYFAVRPVRETIGTLLGRERVGELWGYTGIAAIAIVPIYGALVARVRRGVLLPAIYAIVALSLFGCALLFARESSASWAGEFFYVWISVLNLLLVSVFWSFLLELFDTGQAKRLFGFIAAGGTAGALLGPVLTDLSVQHIGNSGVLVLGGVMFTAAIVCQRLLINIWKTAPLQVATTADRALGGNPFAGFALVLRSPYLLAIALYVVFISVLNTFLYFEQLRLVESTFADVEKRTQVFARLDYSVQTLTVLSQVFLTGRIAQRFGAGALLVLVPLAMIGGFAALAMAGSFAVLAVVFVLRRWGEYAFIRPAREMLFSTLDAQSKYKAKNLIDVPVYRVADWTTAQVRNWLESGMLGATGVAWLGAVIAGAWAINGWWLGRRHRERATLQP